MPGKSPLSDMILPFESIELFFDEVQRRHITAIKVADQGLVEPMQRGSTWVMQPMVRVVATAFDFDANKILRWHAKWPVGSSVTISATGERGRHNDATGIRTRDAIINEALRRSIQVVRGEEWTPSNIVSKLAGIGPGDKQ